MCGIFGYVARDGGRPDLRRLEEIAVATQRRGAHAFGLAWIDARGRLRQFKQVGPIADRLSILGFARDARMLVGHCRFATHGDPSRNENNHPHPADSGWYVHNGQIPHYRAIAQGRRLLLQTECDSEIIGRLIEANRGPLLDRCRRAAMECARRPFAMLGVWPRPDRLVAARYGNPLHWGAADEGIYLASLPDGLPDPEEFADRCTLQIGKGGVHA